MTNHESPAPLAVPLAEVAAMSDAALTEYREVVRWGAIDTNDADGRWSVRRNLADAILADRKAGNSAAVEAPEVEAPEAEPFAATRAHAAEAVRYAVRRGVAYGVAPGLYRRSRVNTGPSAAVSIGVDADGRTAVLDLDRREVLALGTLRRHEDGRRWYAARMDEYGDHAAPSLHATRREAVAVLLAGTAWAYRAPVAEVVA